MIASHPHHPIKPTMWMNVLFFMAIVLSLLSCGFAAATNSLPGWIGLFVVSPYAAYQCHKRLHPGSRRGFWVAYWLFFGVPFTLNAVHGSLWWLAFWPVSYMYILVFSMAQMAKD